MDLYTTSDLCLLEFPHLAKYFPFILKKTRLQNLLALRVFLKRFNPSFEHKAPISVHCTIDGSQFVPTKKLISLEFYSVPVKVSKLWNKYQVLVLVQVFVLVLNQCSCTKHFTIFLSNRLYSPLYGNTLNQSRKYYKKKMQLRLFYEKK